MSNQQVDLLQKHERVAASLVPEWTVENDVFSLHLNDATIEMGMETGLDHVVQPKSWLNRTHKDQTVHEPGLVAWMLVLAEHLADKNVRFVDAGSLFGYFSFMADRLFRSCSSIALEANPESAGYISRTIERFNYERVSVEHCLLSDQAREDEVRYVDGFVFQKDPASEAASGYDSNAPKRQVVVNERHLQDFIDESGDMLNIVKVDAEGHQAEFLPPATAALVKSRSIMLMEFDLAEQMSAFNSSNAALCQPFLDADYVMYWGVHRNLDRPFQLETHVRPGMERNSLAVLIPSELA